MCVLNVIELNKDNIKHVWTPINHNLFIYPKEDDLFIFNVNQKEEKEELEDAVKLLLLLVLVRGDDEFSKIKTKKRSDFKRSSFYCVFTLPSHIHSFCCMCVFFECLFLYSDIKENMNGKWLFFYDYVWKIRRKERIKREKKGQPRMSES